MKVILKKNTEPKKYLKNLELKTMINTKKRIRFRNFQRQKIFRRKIKNYRKGFAGVMKRWNFGGLRAFMVFQFPTDHMVQQVKGRSWKGI